MDRVRPRGEPIYPKPSSFALGAYWAGRGGITTSISTAVIEAAKVIRGRFRIPLLVRLAMLEPLDEVAPKHVSIVRYELDQPNLGTIALPRS